MSLTFSQKIALAFWCAITLLWVWIQTVGSTDGFYNYLYSFLFGLVPFFGGLMAMWMSRVWGGLKSAVGKAVFFLGLGAFLWGCGENIWSYYNFFLGVPAPYPSLADLGFAPAIFFYGLGAFYLAKATGAKYALRHPEAKWFVGLAVVAVTALSYYVLVIVVRGGVLVPSGESALKAVLDIMYPLGDFVGLMIGVIVSGLSFPYLGGRYKMDVFAILAGIGVMFIADSIFSYTTTVGTYYNANFGDLMLSLGTFLITFGALGFKQPALQDES